MPTSKTDGSYLVSEWKPDFPFVVNLGVGGGVGGTEDGLGETLHRVSSVLINDSQSLSRKCRNPVISPLIAIESWRSCI